MLDFTLSGISGTAFFQLSQYDTFHCVIKACLPNKNASHMVRRITYDNLAHDWLLLFGAGY